MHNTYFQSYHKCSTGILGIHNVYMRNHLNCTMLWYTQVSLLFRRLDGSKKKF